MKKLDLLRAQRPIGSYKRATLLAGGVESLADFALKMHETQKKQENVWMIPTFVSGAVGAMHVMHMYYYHGWPFSWFW